MKKTIVCACAILGLTALLAGCGGKERPAGFPDLYPTTLTITQAGKPLAGASVNVYPIEGTACTWPVGGRTDNSGKVSLMTQSDFAGVPAGDFAVTVSKSEFSLKEDMTNADGEPIPPETFAGQDLSKVDARFVNVAEMVPEEYLAAETTPLSISVQKGKNAFTLNVDEAGAVSETDAAEETQE